MRTLLRRTLKASSRFSRRISIRSTKLLAYARSKGVCPFCRNREAETETGRHTSYDIRTGAVAARVGESGPLRTVFFTFRFAPCFRSISALSNWPFFPATCRAELPACRLDRERRLASMALGRPEHDGARQAEHAGRGAARAGQRRRSPC